MSELAWDMVDELRDELAAERARTTAANALLQEAVRLVEGYHRPYGWDELSDRIARHLRNEEG